MSKSEAKRIAVQHEARCADSGRIMIEYAYGHPGRYDGVSEIHCRHGRFGRWCKQPLSHAEYEPPFCEGGDHPKYEEET